jgi:hypothetical protein
MKRYKAITAIALLAMISLFSCKKDNTPALPKDYSNSIKDKTWWGTLTNAGETAQYYSVHFNADNTLLWSQFSDDYPGKWSVDKNKLTLTFLSPDVIVTGEISDDNKLVNITTNTANKVNTGELVENPRISLESTIWKGDFNIPMGSPIPIQFSFLPGSIVQGNIGYSFTSVYVRSAYGGVIRFYKPLVNFLVFCVITSSGEMRGSYDLSKYTLQATKQ